MNLDVGKLQPLHLAIFAVAIITLVLAPEIPFELARKDGQLEIDSGWITIVSRMLIAAIFLFEAILLFKALISRRALDALVNLVCASLAIIVFGYSAELHQYVQVAKTNVLVGRYKRCETESVEYDVKKRFAVCDYRYTFDTATIIAFDSGDELPQLSDRRAPRLAALIDDQKLVVLSDCKFRPRKLYDHLYLIVTAC